MGPDLDTFLEPDIAEGQDGRTRILGSVPDDEWFSIYNFLVQHRVHPLPNLAVGDNRKRGGVLNAVAFVSDAMLQGERRLTQAGEIDVDAVVPVLPDQLAVLPDHEVDIRGHRAYGGPRFPSITETGESEGVVPFLPVEIAFGHPGRHEGEKGVRQDLVNLLFGRRARRVTRFYCRIVSPRPRAAGLQVLHVIAIPVRVSHYRVRVVKLRLFVVPGIRDPQVHARPCGVIRRILCER